MIMHEAIEDGLKAGWLLPHVGKAYGMEQAGLAFDEQINAGKSLGKRVIKI